jgi:predicted ATPase
LAGENAFARSAFLEAIDAFTSALVELAKLPESADRDRLEIELRAALGLALIQVKGWSVREVEESYRRARELCQKYGDIPIRVHFGAWAAYVVRGDREVTAELAAVFEKLLEGSTDTSLRLIAHSVLGARAFWSGDYRTADKHLLQGKSYCDRTKPKEQAQSLLRDYGYEGPIYPHVFMLWSDLYQGRERESLEGLTEAFSIARSIANPYVLAMAVGWGAALAHDLGDVDAAEARSQELMTLALDNGLYFWVAIAQSVSGWAKVRRGEIDQGLKSMHDAIATHNAMGSKVLLPYYLSYIAEGCLLATAAEGDHAARIAEGLQAAEDGLEITKTNLATHFIPELKRLKGELLLARGDRSGAERELREARDLSAAQGAVLFERRAAASLARAGGA